MSHKRARSIIITPAVILLIMTYGVLFSLADVHDHEDHEEQEIEKHSDEHESPGETEHDHEHEAPAETEPDGDHEAHEAGEHDQTDETPSVRLTEKDRSLAGISLDQVAQEYITKMIELPGEVGLNEDNVAHIVPRFPGIAFKINKKIGDKVKEGDIMAIVESNESLTTYPVKSLIEGTVIEKHITLGEFVSDESTIFTVANLSQVWINLAVYAKDSQKVKRGQKIEIEQIGTQLSIKGIISYLSPIYEEKSRSFIARVVVPNRGNNWKPGTFVKGLVPVKTPEKVPVVDIKAVQIWNEKQVVFIPKSNDEFIPVPVVLGDRDRTNVHIKEGLHPGDSYVKNGAFEIKAKLVTSTLGDHAGHGH
ncbi:efflux RND transporter periplasmic adaptor subunit [candidate division CSSED10-310 bacterium]|uniref:Efflux RND transporter periplasmic adaptor subunit n=1 Tax=candidate division CSSED10-310 bacterium TaxID=2855610 RepID=A0ABV6YXA8_UNCC1